MTPTSSSIGSGTQSSGGPKEFSERKKTSETEGTYPGPGHECTSNTMRARRSPRVAQSRFLVLAAGQLERIRFPYDYNREREREIIRSLNEETQC